MSEGPAVRRSRRTAQEFWASCLSCGDQFTITIWLRPNAREEGAYYGVVERSRDVRVEGGRPLHRCGGGLRVYGSSARITLES